MIFFKKKKQIAKVNNLLLKMHNNMRYLNEWLGFMHQDHGSTKKVVRELREGHILTKKEVGSLKGWISHFYDFNQELGLYLGQIDGRMKKIEEMLETHGSQMDSLSDVLKSSKQVRPEKKSRSIKEFSSDLSASEKKILYELCKTGKALGYKDIGLLVGRSPSTVKNQVNNIKIKGFPIKSNRGINGKRYFLEESTKNILLSKVKVD